MTSAFIPVALGAFGLLVAFFVYQWIKKSPVGTGPEKDIADRLIFAQILEAITCYEKNIITSAKDANTGSILGLGFPSDSGGILQFVNNYGVLKFRDRSLQLTERYGKRFTPPNLLNEMARTKKVFNSL